MKDLDSSIFDWLGPGETKPSEAKSQPANGIVEISSDTDLESSGPDEVPYTPRALSLIPPRELEMIRAGIQDQARRKQLTRLRAKYSMPGQEACLMPCALYTQIGTSIFSGFTHLTVPGPLEETSETALRIRFRPLGAGSFSTKVVSEVPPGPER